MTTHTITIDTETGHVAGSKAVEVRQTSSHNDNGDITVTFEATAAGDDAIHAGTLTATFVMTRPEVVDQADLDTAAQMEHAGEYANGMLMAMEAILKGGALTQAVMDEVEETCRHEDALKGITAAVLATAAIVLIHAKGDKAKALDLAAGEWMRNAAIEHGISAEQFDQIQPLLAEGIETLCKQAQGE